MSGQRSSPHQRHVEAARARWLEEDQRDRVMVITEFDVGDPEATMHAMAEAILEYRRALRVLGRTVDLAKVGAPVAVLGPGPGWRPRPTIDGAPEAPNVVPSAATKSNGPCG